MSIKRQVRLIVFPVILIMIVFAGIMIGGIAWANNTSEEQVGESSLLSHTLKDKIEEFNIEYKNDMSVAWDFISKEDQETIGKLVERMNVCFSIQNFDTIKLQYKEIINKAIEDKKAYEDEQARIAEEKRLEEEARIAAEEEAARQAAANTYSNNSYSQPSGGLTQQSGVNYYDGRRETYYSSNVLYHYRTSEWSVDKEGFYRDKNGYYVVAASDKPQGSTFKGSKGTCIVLDSGCAAGTTDYYVKW